MEERSKLFSVLQELRGGRLDHEHHDMSEHRETANAAMDQAIPCFAEDIASGRAEEDILVHEHVALRATCS